MYSKQPDRRPPARAKAKRAVLDTLKCVDCKTSLFANSIEVSRCKNIVCLSTTMPPSKR
jgi:hypothetical protein